jgi:hypothetical protein
MHIEDHLLCKWSLVLKDGSKEWMPCKGAKLPPRFKCPADWRKVTKLDALGHVVAFSVDCTPCYLSSVAKAWKATFRNQVAVNRNLSLCSKAKLFQRAVTSVPAFR